MSKQRRAWRWFSAWNDDKEEHWLEKMAQEGWHLVSGPFPYCFEQGAPANVRYRLDYRSSDKGLEEYLSLCSDAGWERVCQFSGWHYFRTARADAPEIYTDLESRIAKYRRLLGVAALLAVTTMAANYSVLSDSGHDRVVLVIRWVVVVLAVLWVYILSRLALHIRGLKRRSSGCWPPSQPAR